MKTVILRFTIFGFALLLGSSFLKSQENSDQSEFDGSMHIYICIGQSNMAGRGYLDSFLLDSMENVFLLNDDGEFEVAVNPLNKYSTIRKEIGMQRLGPSYSFAKKMAEELHHPVGLIVNARGGSSIKSWVKGSKDGYFEEIVKRVEQASKYGEIKGVIWHQGEADLNMGANYNALAAQFFLDLRTEINMPDLPIVFGEISRWNWSKKKNGVKDFNKVLKKLSQIVPNSTCVSSKGLTPLIDETDPHFDSKSQIIFGERYAKEMLKLLD